MCKGTYILSFDAPSTENFEIIDAIPIIDMTFCKFFKYWLLSYNNIWVHSGSCLLSVNPKYIVLPELISTMYHWFYIETHLVLQLIITWGLENFMLWLLSHALISFVSTKKILYQIYAHLFSGTLSCLGT